MSGMIAAMRIEKQEIGEQLSAWKLVWKAFTNRNAANFLAIRSWTNRARPLNYQVAWRSDEDLELKVHQLKPFWMHLQAWK